MMFPRMFEVKNPSLRLATSIEFDAFAGGKEVGGLVVGITLDVESSEISIVFAAFAGGKEVGWLVVGITLDVESDEYEITLVAAAGVEHCDELESRDFLVELVFSSLMTMAILF